MQNSRYLADRIITTFSLVDLAPALGARQNDEQLKQLLAEYYALYSGSCPDDAKMMILVRAIRAHLATVLQNEFYRGISLSPNTTIPRRRTVIRKVAKAYNSHKFPVLLSKGLWTGIIPDKKDHQLLPTRLNPRIQKLIARNNRYFFHKFIREDGRLSLISTASDINTEKMPRKFRGLVRKLIMGCCPGIEELDGRNMGLCWYYCRNNYRIIYDLGQDELCEVNRRIDIIIAGEAREKE